MTGRLRRGDDLGGGCENGFQLRLLIYGQVAQRRGGHSMERGEKCGTALDFLLSIHL